MAVTNVLHIRRLADFGSTIDEWLREQVEQAIEMFAQAGLSLEVESDELLSTAGDGIVHVEECVLNGTGTREQGELFARVSNVVATSIVIFIARDFSPWKGGGCAWHPQGRPGCFVTAGIAGMAKWKLAHELGHVFGLFHHDLSTMLMFPSADWSRHPPLLDEPEINFLRGLGPAPVATVARSLELSEDTLRFELGKLEPDYRVLNQYGTDVVHLLRQIYDGAREEELRVRAAYALSRVSSDI